MANEQFTQRVLKVTFDSAGTDLAGVSNSTIAAHPLAILPDGAIITSTAYDVLTTFTSATDAGEIAFGTTGATTNIKASTAISTGTTYDNVTNMVAGTPVSAATAVKLTAASEVIATVAVEVLTAGKLVWYITYVI